MSLERPSFEGGDEPREWPPEEAVVIRHEEEPTLWKRTKIAGILRGRRRVESERVRADLPVALDRLVEERVPPFEDDDGKVVTLEDGTISIPVYREELVVTKRTVLAERIVIRKESVTETRRVEAELRRERVELSTEGDVEVIGDGVDAAAGRRG